MLCVQSNIKKWLGSNRWLFIKVRLLCHKAPVYRSIQIVMPVSQGTAELYNSSYSKLAEHPRRRRMYDTLRHYYCLPHMSQDVQVYALQYELCTRHRQSNKHQQLLNLFPPIGTFECVVIYIFEPFTLMKQGNQSIIVMIDQYTKYTRAVSVKKIIAPQVANVVLEDRIIPFGIPDVSLTTMASSSPQSLLLHFSPLLAPNWWQQQCTILRAADKKNGITIHWSQ